MANPTAHGIAIIADDLTGAANSVVPFLRNGWRCGLDWEFDGRTPRNFDAIALDTETRDLHGSFADGSVAERIKQRVRGAAEHAIASSSSIVYKKIDSTLRGHLRLELEALQEALPGRIAVVCPAFPDNGRAVLGGDLLVNGRPLQDSDFASNSKGRSCLPTSSVQSAFFGNDSYEIALCRERDASLEIGIDVVRSGVESVRQAVDDARCRGATALFVDAETNSDLTTIARIVMERPGSFLPVGSAGLSAAIASVLRQGKPLAGMPVTQRVENAKRRLIVIGSRHAASRSQASRLRASGVSTHSEIGAALREIQQGKSAAIALSPETDAPVDEVARRWREGGLEWANTRPAVELIISGGATAIEMLRALRPTHWIEVIGEFEPGIVAAEARRRPHASAELPDRFSIVLKAGGFGDSEALTRLVGLKSVN